MFDRVGGPRKNLMPKTSVILTPVNISLGEDVQRDSPLRILLGPLASSYALHGYPTCINFH